MLWKQGTGLFLSILNLVAGGNGVPRLQAARSAIFFRLQLYCVRPFGLGGRAGGEEDYDFKFAELGFEVGGDFGDAFEGLESLVFDVDYGEADCLELAQDAGDFAGFRHTGATDWRGGR